jgi:ferredoxin
MKVWIDQDLCTGDGLCEEIAPAVFTLLDDGLAYVKEEGDVKNDPGGSAGMAAVPGELEEAVVEASEECPGECFFLGGAWFPWPLCSGASGPRVASIPKVRARRRGAPAVRRR